MRTLLTYGDSNTHGTAPFRAAGQIDRFKPEIRWPSVMASHLGASWHLVEEGLPGRTTQWNDPVMGAHMNGHEGLKIALATHRPVALLVIMLGTNDQKLRFEPSVSKITAGIAGLLDIALHRDMAPQHPEMKTLIVCPPAVREMGPIRSEFIGAADIGPRLGAALADLAKARGVEFFDAGSVIETSDLDGVHFDPDAHHLLARALARVVSDMAR